MSVLDREKLQDRCLGSLFGVFIGDAMGLPAECMSPHEIREKFGYIDTYVTNRFHKYQNVAKRPQGTISDDSQLTLAMMDALSRGYDLRIIRQSHLDASKGKWGEPVGWGASTRSACEKIAAGCAVTHSPLGAGNGTPMKISPLAAYCVHKTLSTSVGRFTNSFNASLLKKCKEITGITHGDPRCIVATYCQARMLIRSLQGEMPQTTRRTCNLFIEDAEYAETRLNAAWPDDKLLSDRMRSYFDIQKLSMDTGFISGDICTEKSSFIYNSYPLVAYCVAKYWPYKNFRHAILETVNAGADADSNASMVGAIMGAHIGFSGIPTDMVRGLRKHAALLSHAKAFIQSL